jgi:LmbE family N-acetylglucosaminyl deacetylase
VITNQTVDQLGTVLGVWAHPDDEAFLSAGLMALARSGGNRVVCVTATAGDLGTDQPDLWPPARLAALRMREHRAALAELDVHEIVRLGYVDGSCAVAPKDVAVARLLDVLDEVAPDTVVTFGPDGMTGHPDHRAVSGWATAAVEASARRMRLLYATVTPAYERRNREVSERLGAFPPGLPWTTDPENLAVHLVLGEDLLDRKAAALRAHASQTRAQEVAVGTAAFRGWWAEESFVAAPAPGSPCRGDRFRRGHSQTHRRAPAIT